MTTIAASPELLTPEWLSEALGIPVIDVDGDDMFVTMAQRHGRHVLDLEAERLIPRD